MRLRWFQLLAFLCCALVPTFGQSPAATSSPTLSHVERFTLPKTRAEKTEADASAQLSIKPDDFEALNARALARMQLGRYSDAYEDLHRAVSLQPTNADYQAFLGYTLWKLGRPEEAVRAERAALDLDEKNFTANYQLGRFLLRLGNQKDVMEATKYLKRALEIEPRQVEVRFELIAAYRALGDTVLASAQLIILQDARPADARVTYIAGLLALDRGDLEGAIKGFRDALKRDPTLVGAWQDLGLAYIKMERWPEASEAFAELRKLQTDSADAAYLYALALRNTGRSTDAEREVRRALRLDVGSAASHTLLGIILFDRAGMGPQARDALMQAVALTPENFDAQYYLGRVLGDMKDYNGAVRCLSEAVRLNPKHSFSRFLLGHALEASGQFAAAEQQYKELVSLDPNSAVGQMGLGALLVKQGKVEEALTVLKRAIKLDDTIFESHWSLGRALALAKRYEEAAHAFQRAIQLAPDRPDGHFQLGLALQRLGRKEEAALAFSEAARITSEFRTLSDTEP